MVSVSAIASFAASDDEPIPDFGYQGPVGFERANPVSGAALSGSQPKRFRSMGQEIQILRFTLQRLDLSKSQQAQMETIFEQFADQGAKLRGEMSRMQDTIRAVRASDGNASDVNQARIAMVSLTKNSGKLRSEVRRSIMNVLSKDQKEKFNQIQEEMRDRAKRRARTWEPVL